MSPNSTQGHNELIWYITFQFKSPRWVVQNLISSREKYNTSSNLVLVMAYESWNGITTKKGGKEVIALQRYNYEPLTRYVKLRVAYVPGCRERFPRHRVLAIPTCITARVPRMPCMPGSLTIGFLCSRWRGKRSQHSRCMHYPQFYVSGKRPM